MANAIRDTRVKKGQSASFPGSDYYFQPGITYSDLTSGKFSCRYTEGGFVFDIKGSSIFCVKDEPSDLYVLGLFNSCVANDILNILNPTISYQAGNIRSVPLLIEHTEKVEKLVEKALEISKQDWNSFETSWDFTSHPLVRIAKADNTVLLSKAYEKWETICESRFQKLKETEEELNSIFIDIYGLADELSPEVEDKDVSVCKADIRTDIRSLLSTAVGGIFGRYS